MPLTRDGLEVSQEPVAGNYDGHSNIWQMALVSPLFSQQPNQIGSDQPYAHPLIRLHQTMWQLITVLEPPLLPRLTDEFRTGTIDNTYGALLGDNVQCKNVDVELRRTVARCLKHDPRDRPALETLLQQAKVGAARRAQNAQAVRDWVQKYVYNA